MEARYKSSRFWVQLEFLGEIVKSDIKLWDTEFMKGELSGKTDFKLGLRRILRLLEGSRGVSGTEGEKFPVVGYSEKVFKTLLDGLWIELYEEYPVIHEILGADGEKQKKAVIENGLPKFKTAIRGVTKINTASWILNPNLNSTDLVIQNKFYFYKSNYKTIPEFHYENYVTTFKPSEIEAIDTYVAAKREKLAKQEAEEREKAAAEKVPDKKDAKKDTKAKKPDDKNAPVVEVVDPEGISFVKDYKLIEKVYTQSVNDTEAGEFVVPGKLEGHKSKKTQEAKPKELTAEDKMKQKSKNIMKNYDVILAQKQWITVKLAINQPEKVEIIPQEDPEPQSKQPAKGKKK